MDAREEHVHDRAHRGVSLAVVIIERIGCELTALVTLTEGDILRGIAFYAYRDSRRSALKYIVGFLALFLLVLEIVLSEGEDGRRCVFCVFLRSVVLERTAFKFVGFGDSAQSLGNGEGTVVLLCTLVGNDEERASCACECHIEKVEVVNYALHPFLYTVRLVDGVL